MSSEVVQVFRVVYRFIFLSLSLSLWKRPVRRVWAVSHERSLVLFFSWKEGKKNKGTVGRETESWVGSGWACCVEICILFPRLASTGRKRRPYVAGSSPWPPRHSRKKNRVKWREQKKTDRDETTRNSNADSTSVIARATLGKKKERKKNGAFSLRIGYKIGANPAIRWTKIDALHENEGIRRCQFNYGRWRWRQFGRKGTLMLQRRHLVWTETKTRYADAGRWTEIRTSSGKRMSAGSIYRRTSLAFRFGWLPPFPAKRFVLFLFSFFFFVLSSLFFFLVFARRHLMGGQPFWLAVGICVDWNLFRRFTRTDTPLATSRPISLARRRKKTKKNKTERLRVVASCGSPVEIDAVVRPSWRSVAFIRVKCDPKTRPKRKWSGKKKSKNKNEAICRYERRCSVTTSRSSISRESRRKRNEKKISEKSLGNPSRCRPAFVFHGQSVVCPGAGRPAMAGDHWTERPMPRPVNSAAVGEELPRYLRSRFHVQSRGGKPERDGAA